MKQTDELRPAVAPLWTRDFTIITLGSVVSMLGNAMSGFALSLLVLDYTESSLLYAIYIATFTAPQIIAPIFSGAILDRFSRKRTIYTLDFISAGIYAMAAFILSRVWWTAIRKPKIRSFLCRMPEPSRSSPGGLRREGSSGSSAMCATQTERPMRAVPARS